MNHIVRVAAAPSTAATPNDSPARPGPTRRRRDPGPLALPQSEHTQRWPGLAPEVAERIAGWGPPKLRTAEQRAAWQATEGTLRGWVAALAPPTPNAASTDLWAVSRFGTWAFLSLGTLDPTIVCTSHNIEHFVGAALDEGWPEGRCHALRTALYRVCRAVNRDGFALAPPPIGRAEVAKPYTPSQENHYVLDASMPGRRNRVACAAVTFLSMGAGARGPQIIAAGPQDLVVHRGGRVSLLIAGSDPREVPIREPYTELALWAARECHGDRFITATNRSAVANTAHRIQGGDGCGLSLRRARSTWLAAHLVAFTPLAALRKFAGPVGGPTLTALLDHTSSELDAQAALEMGWGA